MSLGVFLRAPWKQLKLCQKNFTLRLLQRHILSYCKVTAVMTLFIFALLDCQSQTSTYHEMHNQ